MRLICRWPHQSCRSFPFWLACVSISRAEERPSLAELAQDVALERLARLRATPFPFGVGRRRMRARSSGRSSIG